MWMALHTATMSRKVRDCDGSPRYCIGNGRRGALCAPVQVLHFTCMMTIRLYPLRSHDRVHLPIHPDGPRSAEPGHDRERSGHC
ncbi:hypothetical protein CY34DRAFT_754350 [Suillus luteus UH-Slu-Lm8-n1]|uniref:Uncharacterized protein n=1 Tax=Suillus luteus UH-Slu-Lm8-n1 TaxID=930992 RepID=A0A0D0BHT0_9AGAM|nr:hypothetical protein CY34DRAFT_754350 [Suillus luteus UH-Slu-Lm8-n1]